MREKVKPIALESDRICLAPENRTYKNFVPKSCEGCMYEVGFVDCSHPKAKKKDFSEIPMTECYTAEQLKNGKPVKRKTKDKTYVRVD